MQDKKGIAHRLANASLRGLRTLVTRILTSLVALLVAGAMATVGFVLMLAGVLVAQQVLARVFRRKIAIADAFGMLSRVFASMAHVSHLGATP